MRDQTIKYLQLEKKIKDLWLHQHQSSVYGQPNLHPPELEEIIT